MTPTAESGTWRKSSRSQNTTTCVEVAAMTGGTRLVRDTKQRQAGHLTLADTQWHGLVTAIKNGHLDH